MLPEWHYRTPLDTLCESFSIIKDKVNLFAKNVQEILSWFRWRLKELAKLINTNDRNLILKEEIFYRLKNSDLLWWSKSSRITVTLCR